MQAETTYNAILGRVITRLREQKGISRDEMCKRISVSVSTWSRIERGEAAAISTGHMKKIADTLETTPGKIYGTADTTQETFQNAGWVVHSEPAKKVSKTAKVGIALVGLAALTGFVVNAMRDNDDKDKQG